MTALHKTKWFLPLFSVALGLLFLGALWAGGERRTGSSRSRSCPGSACCFCSAAGAT